MNPLSSNAWSGWCKYVLPTGSARSADDYLLQIVDAGLGGVVFIAPYFFGGRHDLGRLVLVSLIAITAVAWCARAALLPVAYWPRTRAYVVLLLSVASVLFQIIPLPHPLLAFLSPRTVELLPLWVPGGHGAADLPTWHTLSLTPHETTKSLAMLLAYSLLFVVVAGRIQERADIGRCLRWIGISTILMAVFGVVQYLTSDGRFFWFYQHPFRSTARGLGGPFINRNHFADFLVLGVGPLAGWLLGVLRGRSHPPAGTRPTSSHWLQLLTSPPVLLGAALATVTFVILLSLSRGGTLALFVAITVIGSIYRHGKLVDSNYLWGAVGLCAIVLGLLTVYGYDDVSRRLSSLADASMDEADHNQGRRKIWRANLAAICAGGLFGSGAGSHQYIYPVYLPESLPYEYSHAENGYLQTATENGIVGAALLLAGLSFCGAWSVACFRAVNSDADRLLFGAAVAGLSASAAHAFVDFVWYIPACMSLTVILAACLFRLSQFCRMDSLGLSVQGMARVVAPGRPDAPPPNLTRSFADTRLMAARWVELTAACVLIGTWCVWTFVGPGMASLYWDRYLFASASDKKLSEQQWSDLTPIQSTAADGDKAALNRLMLRQLSQVVSWDPKFARARLRMAAKCMAEFELRQLAGPNRMTLAAIRDAAASSSFDSPAKLQSWLRSTFGSDLELLRRAQAEARVAVSLCPLQGEGYLYLADLCFLDGRASPSGDDYVEQGLRVRPHDAYVLFEVGEHELAAGNVSAAMKHWQQCYRDPGPQPLKIVYLLAGRIPAAAFLSTFEPDWRTLWPIWLRYRDSTNPQDIHAVLAYSAEVTRKFQARAPRRAPEFLLAQSKLYSEAGRDEQAIACLEEAYACDPLHFHVRERLAKELAKAGRFPEAETHFRWCLARRPADKKLSDGLRNILKQRFASRTLGTGPTHGSTWGYAVPHQRWNDAPANSPPAQP